MSQSHTKQTLAFICMEDVLLQINKERLYSKNKDKALSMLNSVSVALLHVLISAQR